MSASQTVILNKAIGAKEHAKDSDTRIADLEAEVFKLKNRQNPAQIKQLVPRLCI